MGLVILRVEIISLNSINQFIFLIEKCCVFFEAVSEFLNIV
jgi:hypothetical protein